MTKKMKNFKNDSSKTDYQREMNRMKEFKEAEKSAKILNTEQEGFIKSSLPQKQILKNANLLAKSKKFELKLKYGPYRIDFSPNGRYLVMAGQRGHLAAFDWMTKSLHFDINVLEKIYDVKYCHQETMIAVAQHRYTHIYDKRGTELHCMRSMDEPRHLQFLPHHMLLVAASRTDMLHWLDISTGQLVASHRVWSETHSSSFSALSSFATSSSISSSAAGVVGDATGCGAITSLCHDASSGVCAAGQRSGVVSMWVPSSKSPPAKLLAHPGAAVRAIAWHQAGRYLATAGHDNKLKLWDVRHAMRELADVQLFSAAASIDFSAAGGGGGAGGDDATAAGLLAVCSASQIQVFANLQQRAFNAAAANQNAAENNSNNTSHCRQSELLSGRAGKNGSRLPYLRHRPQFSHATHIRFCPFEDVLGIGLVGGVETCLVPGAGLANYDAFEENPFATAEMRNEAEVKRLLSKVPPEMIQLAGVCEGATSTNTNNAGNSSQSASLGRVNRDSLLEKWEAKRTRILGNLPQLDPVRLKKSKAKGRASARKMVVRKEQLTLARAMFKKEKMEAECVRERQDKQKIKTAYTKRHTGTMLDVLRAKHVV